MTKIQVDSNGKAIMLNSKALEASGGTLTTKTITENGTYTASADNADGYSSVSVNVAGTTPSGILNITANGTYDVTNYASADVSVSGGGSDNIVVTFMNRGEYGWSNTPATLTIGNETKNMHVVYKQYHALGWSLPKNSTLSYVCSQGLNKDTPVEFTTGSTDMVLDITT